MKPSPCLQSQSPIQSESPNIDARRHSVMAVLVMLVTAIHARHRQRAKRSHVDARNNSAHDDCVDLTP